jgi:two-component system response regulator DevR
MNQGASEPTHRVLVIDDHEVVRQGIIQALRHSHLEVVGEASTCSEAYAQIAHKVPDAIIVDLNLPDGSGLEIVKWARKNSQTMAIVVLTLNESDDFLLAAAQSGASAYILKSAPLGFLIRAVESALLDPQYFLSSDFVKAIERKRITFSMTARELEVLAILDSEKNNLDLSLQLFISEATLKTHLASIYRKLEVKNRVGAVKRARLAGLL